MPYQYCPACRLTVHAADGVAAGGPCPRCGDALAEEPRPLIGSPPTGLDPEAVRVLLHRFGGRFQPGPPARARSGRFSGGSRRAA